MSAQRILIATGVVGALLVIPSLAFSAQTLQWDFQGGIPGRWDVRGLLPRPQTTPQGLLIETERDGSIRQRVRFPFKIEGITVTVVSDTPAELLFLWHRLGTPEGEFVQLPFIVRGGGIPETIALDVRKYDQWDNDADEVGFAIPKGTRLLLQRIDLQQWSALEKMREAILGFMTFEHRRAHITNFLWGPLLPLTPIARRQLFSDLEPDAPSFNWLFYSVLVASGILAIVLWKKGIRNAMQAFSVWFTIFGALWILYDLRMTGEAAWQAMQDVRLYILHEEQGDERGLFEEIVRIADELPILLPGNRGRYVFIGPSSRFLSYMRHRTYPWVPITPESPDKEMTYWLVFHKPSVHLTEGSELAMGETILSHPGEIVRFFSPHSFLFRSSQ